MRKVRTKPWNAADYYKTDETRAAYLDLGLEDGHFGVIMAMLRDLARARRPAILGNYARARRLAIVARRAGLDRESLDRALSANGNPDFATVLRIVHALGLRLSATVAAPEAEVAEAEVAEAEVESVPA